MASDFKPSKRIIDQEASIRKILQDRNCRVCRKQADEGHHILLRSQSGDDVEGNIVPLCRACHYRYHSQAEGWIPLTANETLYLRGKLKGRAEAYAEKRRLVLR